MESPKKRTAIPLQDLILILIQMIALGCHYFDKHAWYTNVLIWIVIGYTTILIGYDFYRITKKPYKINLFFNKKSYWLLLLTSCCWLIVYFIGDRDLIHITLSLFFIQIWISKVYSLRKPLSIKTSEELDNILDTEEFRR
ncbi:MAG: hypothetical protein AB8G15_08195 [Saprospiraceae bacterium]